MLKIFPSYRHVLIRMMRREDAHFGGRGLGIHGSKMLSEGSGEVKGE